MESNERLEQDSLSRWKRIRGLGQDAFSGARRDALLDALKDQAASVRLEAVHYLGKLGHRDGVSPLSLLALEDTSFVVRKEAVLALQRIDSPEAVPALMKVLDDKVPDVRLAAVNALIKIGTTEAIGALKKASNDPDFNVRYKVLEVVERFKSLLA